ncbi:MAG: serine O-acetyltransferase [Dehalococcoidia bacterium]|nr:serine O-acetyltransferase [Dehalococcoidia bacterium]
MSIAKTRAAWRRMRSLVSRDIDIHAEWPLMFGLVNRKRPRWFLFLYLLFSIHMFPAVMLYRLQSFFYEAGFPPIATFFSRLNDFLFDVAIGNQVRSNGALLISHGHVVLDGWTTLGHHVTINPFVTLGIGNSSQKPFELFGPTIGDYVNIGTGAKVIGRVTIGDYARIGANAVVLDDVPAESTAVGAPARHFPTRRGPGDRPWEPPKA